MKSSATATTVTNAVGPPTPLAMKKPVSLAAGPLGPVWQPYYDGLYSFLQMTFNLPHLSFLTLIYVLHGWYSGDLKLNIFMPLVAVFGMARVPFVGIGMSMCLHRYFAHGAFKTSRPVQFILGIIGAMSLQGGVLWWASKHIRHHKHCDQPLDPHSPSQTSEMYAWIGWLYYETHHDWAYLPQRLLTPEMLFINLIFVFPNAIVTWSLVPFVGKEWALFLCWVPACFGALATTHFNVDYHPVQSKRTGPIVCTTVNKERGDKGIGPLRLDWLAKYAPFMFEPLVGEAFHEDHHDFPRRAQRPGIDVPYLFVLRPLERLGIIWDLQQPLSPLKKLVD
jgi:stearoyl-CoA desaturase (Delta-9 desaturase)